MDDFEILDTSYGHTLDDFTRSPVIRKFQKEWQITDAAIELCIANWVVFWHWRTFQKLICVAGDTEEVVIAVWRSQKTGILSYQ